MNLLKLQAPNIFSLTVFFLKHGPFGLKFFQKKKDKTRSEKIIRFSENLLKFIKIQVFF